MILCPKYHFTLHKKLLILIKKSYHDNVEISNQYSLHGIANEKQFVLHVVTSEGLVCHFLSVKEGLVGRELMEDCAFRSTP
jgi:hypothetical protein